MIRAIIVDDEKLARDVINAYLKKHTDVEVVAQCDNGFEGIKSVNELKPDLIFLDIQMPKLTGFEMLELLDHKPVIIFSTAFDQFALQAFENNASDYLLKPYNQSRFDVALEKAKDKLKGGQDKSEDKILDDLAQVREASGELMDRVVVKSGNKIVIIPTSDIDHIEAQDDYVAFYSKGKKHLKQMTMKRLEAGLSKDEFIRVHRSHIVAVNNIDRLEPYSKDSYVAILRSGEKVPVSRSGYNSLKSLLDF